VPLVEGGRFELILPDALDQSFPTARCVFYRPLATIGLPAFDTFSFRIVSEI